MNARMLPILLLATLSLAGCSDNPAGLSSGEPVTVTASLTTPHHDDGALLVHLEGQGMSRIESASSAYRIYWRLISDHEAAVIVIGNVAAGPLFTFETSAGDRVPAFTASVGDAASRNDAARTSLTGYSVTLSAAP